MSAHTYIKTFFPSAQVDDVIDSHLKLMVMDYVRRPDWVGVDL